MRMMMVMMTVVFAACSSPTAPQTEPDVEMVCGHLVNTYAGFKGLRVVRRDVQNNVIVATMSDGSVYEVRLDKNADRPGGYGCKDKETRNGN